MPNITDSTYYEKLNLFIPNNNNLNADIQGVPNNISRIDAAISKYERELLIGVFGIGLYNQLNTALDDLPSADIKWQNLVNGIDYTKEGVVYRFDGLRGYEKDSLVANYVFCKYMEVDESYYSTTGVTKSKAANANNFNPTRKYLDSWYSFLEKYQNGDTSGVNVLYDTFGNPIGVDYFGSGNDSGLVTLETYLNDHKEDFDGYVFKRYTSANSLGI